MVSNNLQHALLDQTRNQNAYWIQDDLKDKVSDDM